jgi:hypothetical protein
MIEQKIQFNPAQQIGLLLQAKNKADIWGRGTGKSAGIAWDINLINRTMPRALTAVTGQTFGQLLTRTLPSTFKLLESMGYKMHVSAKDPGNYVINRRPPDHFLQPYEKVMKFDNFISFSNGNGLLLLSQDRAGSARGASVDYEILDEALTINKQRYDEETSPTNRGNEGIFGPRSPQPIPWHHGFHYSSSMPYTAEQKWLLDIGNYYEKERGIRFFEIWNRIIKLQLELLDCESESEFKSIWNETVRLKKSIAPFVSKDGTLFTLANAFDNIQNVGFSYIRREYKKQTLLTFLIEIMNMVIDKVEDCYYPLSDRHIYYNATNDAFIRDVAEDSNFDWNRLSEKDCRYDSDCDTHKPLELSFDWGARISLLTVSQPRNFDFVTGLFSEVELQNFINEFFVKPDQAPTTMINALIDSFCRYYEHHQERTVIYIRDRYGDHRQANSSQSYNEQAIERLKSNGWYVIPHVHQGMEPPQHDKFLLIQNIFKEADPRFPGIRFNGVRCKFSIISMNNTRVTEHDGRFGKDKKSESSRSGVLPEEATHFGDAIDKIIWTKFNSTLRFNNNTFVPVRIKN